MIEYFNNLINVFFMSLVILIFFIFTKNINYKKVSNLIKTEHNNKFIKIV